MRYDWEGQSLVGLRRKMVRIAEINDEILRLARERGRIQDEFLADLAALVGRPGARLIDSHHGCPESPIEKCVFEITASTEEPRCLFCAGDFSR